MYLKCGAFFAGWPRGAPSQRHRADCRSAGSHGRPIRRGSPRSPESRNHARRGCPRFGPLAPLNSCDLRVLWMTPKACRRTPRPFHLCDLTEPVHETITVSRFDSIMPIDEISAAPLDAYRAVRVKEQQNSRPKRLRSDVAIQGAVDLGIIGENIPAVVLRGADPSTRRRLRAPKLALTASWCDPSATGAIQPCRVHSIHSLCRAQPTAVQRRYA